MLKPVPICASRRYGLELLTGVIAMFFGFPDDALWRAADIAKLVANFCSAAKNRVIAEAGRR